MHFWGKIINVHDKDMPRPEMYGWFHLLFVIMTVFTAIWLYKFWKKPKEKTVRTIILVISLLSILLEIYKQFNYTFSYDGNVITADYQWYAFPFQFCSTPMYIGLLAALVKNQKLHKAFCNYLATFSLFGGLCVMVYPAQVFIGTIGINIQTMVCHGSMVALGIYLLCSGYIELKHKTILPAISVFAVIIIAAIAMNETAHITGLLERESFNMLYISPHCEPSLPVYSLVQQVVPYPFCLIIYITSFSLAAYIMLLIAIGINCINNKIRHRKSK